MDIVLVCIKENKKIPKFIGELYIEKIKREYREHYKLLNSLKGKKYLMFSKRQYLNKDLYCGTYEFALDTDSISAESVKYLVEDEFDEKYYNFDNGYYQHQRTAIVFENSYLEDFKKTIDIFTNYSKIGLCSVLFRMQSDPPEKVVGIITKQKFFEMLEKKQIFKNVDYIISDRNIEDEHWHP